MLFNAVVVEMMPKKLSFTFDVFLMEIRTFVGKGDYLDCLFLACSSKIILISFSLKSVFSSNKINAIWQKPLNKRLNYIAGRFSYNNNPLFWQLFYLNLKLEFSFLKKMTCSFNATKMAKRFTLS